LVLGSKEVCLQKNPVFSLAERSKKMQRLGLWVSQEQSGVTWRGEAQR